MSNSSKLVDQPIPQLDSYTFNKTSLHVKLKSVTLYLLVINPLICLDQHRVSQHLFPYVGLQVFEDGCMFFLIVLIPLRCKSRYNCCPSFSQWILHFQWPLQIIASKVGHHDLNVIWRTQSKIENRGLCVPPTLRFSRLFLPFLPLSHYRMLTMHQLLF